MRMDFEGVSIKRVVELAEQWQSEGKKWHFHMLFPDCIFNKHKGKWKIVFEDKDSEDVLESVTDTEPLSDLRAIEALYFAQER